MSSPRLFRSLILEGCDGAGKSTIVRDITNPDLCTYHAGGPPTSDIEFLESFRHSIQYLDECNENNIIPIFDRCRPISEMVYGPIVRGQQYFRDDVLYSWLDRMSPIIIYVNPGFDVIWERAKDMPVKDHKDDKHVKFIRENIHQVYEAYEHVMRHMKHRYTVFDIGSPAPLVDIRRIAECADF